MNGHEETDKEKRRRTPRRIFMHGFAAAAAALGLLLGVTGPAAVALAAEPASYTQNGQPFFPIATWGHQGYPGGDNPYQHMAEYAAAGFNRFDWYLSWSSPPETELARLDAAQAAGLSIRYMVYQFLENGNWAIKKPYLQNLVTQLKDHPAFFGYRTQDEPVWNHQLAYADLLDLKNTIVAIDPDHPVVLNFCWYSLDEWRFDCHDANDQEVYCSVSVIQQWLPVGTSYSMDIYPKGRPVSICADTWVRLRDEVVNDPSVPLAIVTIGHDTSSYYTNGNLAEVRFMAFDAVTEGCKGIDWYGVNNNTITSDMWSYITTVAGELAELEDVLASGATIDESNHTVPPALNAICKHYPLTCSAKHYLIVTNPSDTARNSQQIIVDDWTGSIEKQTSGGGWAVVGSGSSITANFVAWDTHVYRADADVSPPGQAHNPDPSNGSTTQGIPSQLSWTPGTDAASQKLYLSYNQSDVSSRASGALKLTDATGAQTSYVPSGLQKSITYYWCVDTFMFDGNCATQGEIWSFHVGQKGDLDADGDVDQEDFGFFQSCLSGFGVMYPSGCGIANLDGDQDVDAGDFEVFLGCMGGPNQPPGC